MQVKLGAWYDAYIWRVVREFEDFIMEGDPAVTDLKKNKRPVERAVHCNNWPVMGRYGCPVYASG